MAGAKSRSYVARLRRRLQKRRTWRQTDVFVVSYPKCGRTWFRMMLGQAISRASGVGTDDPMDLFAVSRAIRDVPMIEFTHDDHASARPVAEVDASTKDHYAGKRVILLVRDPRDAIVSNSFHNAFRKGTFDGTVADYVRKDIGGLGSLIAFYNAWARERIKPRGFLLVHYEDLHNRPVEVLQEVFAFLALDVPPHETLSAAVDASSFENMRSLEARNTVEHRRLKAANQGDERSYKTREGKVGTYSRHLEPAEVEFVETLIRDRLDPYYERYRQR